MVITNQVLGIKKYRGLNSSDGGNIGDRVKIAGGVIGSGDEIVNLVKQIHAIVDGKAVVITESSVRNDLLFDDEDGGIPRPQETMLGAPAQTRFERVFEKPNEPPLLRRFTHLEVGEGSHGHILKRWNTVPATPYDSPLTGGYTPESDKGRLKLKELMVMYTKLSKQVLDLEKEKDAQAVEILKLDQRVESFDDDLDEEDASKQGRTSDKTKPMFKDSNFDDLDDLGVSTTAPRTPPTTTTVIDDEDVTMSMAQTLIKMKREEKLRWKRVALKRCRGTYSIPADH
ncbi:hypothetical protein Tco_0893944 [Tanacetum coccineum]|uniref:Uncharacterized protein n=1 Tax=Tanacetum coccineum TaxID=301880 RepID=A0ABQ5CBT8_9ASTR